jgi:hypothetical protein
MIGKIVTQVPSGTFEVPLISHFRLLGSKGITMSHGVHMSRKNYDISLVITFLHLPQA